MRRDILCVAWSLCRVVAWWSLAAAVPLAVAQEGDVQEADSEVVQETPPRPEMPFAKPGAWEPDDELKRAKALHELVRQELELRDDQVKAVNELFEEYLEAMAEQAKKMEAARQENAARIEELQREAADARRNEDREGVREIVQELGELTGADGTLVKLRRQFFKDVGEVLDEEQALQFRRLAGRAMRTGGAGRLGALWNLQILRRALQELELPPEQKRAALRQFKGLQEKLSEAHQEGEEAMNRLAAETRQAVLAELDEQQVAALEEAETQLREKFTQRRARRRPGQESLPPAQATPEAQEEPAEDDEAYTEENDQPGGA